MAETFLSCGEREGRVVPAPPPISVLGSQAAFWESGTLTLTYRLFTELEALALRNEDEY